MNLIADTVKNITLPISATAACINNMVCIILLEMDFITIMSAIEAITMLKNKKTILLSEEIIPI